MKQIWIFIAGMAATVQGADTIPMIASTTDIAWAAKEIGGVRVEVHSLLKGTENPHYVDAVPEFIRLASEARVACVVGLDLEIGWMPKVLERSGNSQVQPGGQGYCETAKGVQVLEKPAGNVDRSMGDIHPAGNPHYWLSPKHFAQGAKAIAETLGSVDPGHVAEYQANLKRFDESMNRIHEKHRARLDQLVAGKTGPVLLEYHKEFAYFLEAYGLKSLGSIEEKPGVAPSAGRLAEVALAAKNAGVRFVLAAETSPKKTVERFAEISGLPVVTVPMSLQGGLTYEQFQDQMVERIAKALQTPQG